MISFIKKIINSQLVLRIIEVLDRRSDNRLCEKGMIAQAFEFKKINNVKGDYFEFGLWRGKTFIYAHRMKHRYNQDDMLLWGFDSFSGLPQIDDGKNNVWSEGQFACSEIEFREILRKNNIKNEEYRLISGYYKDSLNETLHKQLSGRKAAIVYIDCDLYDSTIQALNFIHRYLVDGSIICLDDYYTYKGRSDQGEQKALGEFLIAHDNIKFSPYFDYSPVGKAFIVNLQ